MCLFVIKKNVFFCFSKNLHYLIHSQFQGFFKSLRIIKENFGKIHLHFGEPISARKFFAGKLDSSTHSMSPLHIQEITEKEKALIPSLAHKIVQAQQKCGTITAFNLVSLALNYNLVASERLLTVKELVWEVRWLKDLMERLGAFVYTEDVEESVNDCFLVHENLIEASSDHKIRLVQNDIVLDKVNSTKLKGHLLSERCMTFSVPFVMLQIYVNPTLHYLVDMALVVMILRCHKRLKAGESVLIQNYARSSVIGVQIRSVLCWCVF